MNEPDEHRSHKTTSDLTAHPNPAPTATPPPHATHERAALTLTPPIPASNDPRSAPVT